MWVTTTTTYYRNHMHMHTHTHTHARARARAHTQTHKYTYQNKATSHPIPGQQLQHSLRLHIHISSKEYSLLQQQPYNTSYRIWLHQLQHVCSRSIIFLAKYKHWLIFPCLQCGSKGEEQSCGHSHGAARDHARAHTTFAKPVLLTFLQSEPPPSRTNCKESWRMGEFVTCLLWS